jgi:homopolymeric O-antigen transport system ATP-binding protein
MSDIAIRVERLGKLYRIGARRRQYYTFREALIDSVATPLRKLSSLVNHRIPNPSTADPATIWALRNVSFEIKRGEVVGIIGRNGAGKSTLLKILSRITEPTEGRAVIHGRIGSLLEVGTGFHSELTGRENIYLSGAILGMGRAEITRKFDEIVDFAEVAKFIDTPVKHYSSGMYLRLAFAVAAHLEPEILLVDEVLAVGDARFQKKCLNKMQDVGQQGRTVLFVSHNMLAVARLCERTILLNEGGVERDGPSSLVVKAYLESDEGTTAVRQWTDATRMSGGDVARLCAVRVTGEDGRVTGSVDIRRRVGIEIEYDVLRRGFVLMPSIHVHNEDGVHVFSAVDCDPLWRHRTRESGRYISTAWIPGNLLAEGTMYIDVALETLTPMTHQFRERSVLAFQVVDSFDGDSARGDYPGPFGGVVRPALTWQTRLTTSGTEPPRSEPPLG